MDDLQMIRECSNSYLVFYMGEEFFAAHVANVNNIVEVGKITKVPKSPAYMRGVTNLRGMVLPVMDLRVRFGMDETQITSNTCILVTEFDLGGERQQIGALVDGVNEVVGFASGQILPPPSVGNYQTTEFIKGIASHNGEFVMVLDMKQIFTADEIADVAGNIKTIKENAEKLAAVEEVN